MLHLPKPLLTANIYCDHCLDQVVHQVLAPFWREASGIIGEAEGYLWFIRYGRCGEHVKIRLHAPEHLGPRLQDWLEADTDEFFRNLAAAVPPSEERVVNLTLPPMDAEDAAQEGYPDRTLLWTHYEPSPIILGSERLLPDQRLASLFTRCFAAATELSLQSFQPDESGRFTSQLRQGIIIRLALTLLATFPWTLEEVQAYLAYHRDWLVRYMLSRGAQPSHVTLEGTVARFDEHFQKSPGALSRMQSIMQDWNPNAAEDDECALLRQRARELYSYIVRFRTDPGPQLDPYAPDQVYLPIFKCLHGVGNQIGLPMSQEAQVFHLLASAASRAIDARATDVAALAL